MNHNLDVQYQRCTYGNGATLLFFKVWSSALAHAVQVAYSRIYVRTDSYVTTKIFRLMVYQSF